MDVDVARRILTYVLDDNASGRQDSDEEGEGSDAEQASEGNQGSQRRRR